MMAQPLPRVGKIPDAPPGLGPNGKPFCRGCGKEVTGRRQSWCSDDCVEEAMLRAFPSTARRAVEVRDRGVCAECGADAEQAHRVMRYLHGPNSLDFHRDTIAEESVGLIYTAWGVNRWTRWDGIQKHLWEADHILPVAEGGGGCGLDNYRTLCIPCHRAETRALRARLSSKRKATQ